jgi:hypothetical protein
LILFLALGAMVAGAATNIERFQSHDFVFPATAPGNPFDVEIAGEFSGPAGAHLRIPGFYDGDGRWIIRFAPNREGEWQLRTVSSLAALDGKTETGIRCDPNRSNENHGGLRVDPAHPYHFVYEDGTRYFLLGYEADWLWGADMQDPDRRLMRKLIDQMASRGFNHVMVNLFAWDTSWSKGREHAWDWGPAPVFPWEGTNEKPDHSRLNPQYFRIYDGMMSALRDKGIVAHIMLKVYNKMVNWPKPYSRDEERYFRYVTARYQAYSNLVWDFSKEAHNERDLSLQARLLDLVRSNDAYHHLLTAHDDDVFYWTPEYNRVLDFRTDQQHTFWPEMIAFDRTLRRYPVLNSEFGYERGVDKFPTYRVEHDWEEQLRRAWLIYLAGGYGVYYYHNTAWDVVKPEPEPPGMKRFQLLKDTLSALPYWRMEPHNELAVGGPCLALPGEVYAVYVARDPVTVNLTGMQTPEKARAQWIDTWTGKTEMATLQPAPVQRMLRKPDAFGDAPAVLVIR